MGVRPEDFLVLRGLGHTLVKELGRFPVEGGMTPKRRIVPILGLLALVTSLALPLTKSLASSPPSVTVSGKAFPEGLPDRSLHSCTFPIGFQGFTPGQEARVVFRAVAPTAPTSGDNVVLQDAIVLPSASHIVTYDLRAPLVQRFRPGSIGGWDVELRVEVAGPAGTNVDAARVLVIANDCIVPLPPTTVTTATTLPPCPSGGCRENPPGVVLAGARGAVAGEPGSHCWSPGGGGPARCVDSLFRDPATALAVTRGEPLSLRFETEEVPSEVKVYRHDTVGGGTEPLLAGEEWAVPAANPSSMRADFPVGTSWLVVATRWLQGSSVAFFEVDVRATEPAQPAAATRAHLAVTG